MSTENKPMTTQERIKADAERYAGLMVWVNTSNDPDKEALFHEHISSTSYIAGATDVYERVQPAIDTLEQIANSPVPANQREMAEWVATARMLAIAAIEQWEGEKEKQVQLSCMVCGTKFMGSEPKMCCSESDLG